MSLTKSKIGIVCFMCWLLSAFNLSCGQKIELRNQALNLAEQDSFFFYKLSNKNESADNILRKYRSGEFKRLNNDILNAGIAKKCYWIHFSISNPGIELVPVIIDIDNSRLNEIELFSVLDNNIFPLGKLGDFFKFSQRPIPHKSFIYQDTLKPRQRKEYLLFVNQVGHALTLPIKAFDPKIFRSAIFGDYLLDGFTYGILLFVAILSLFFFLSSKYYLYLYYALYILTAIGWLFSYFGLGYQYIWSNYPFLNTAMAPLMASLNVLLNLKICQILLKIPKSRRVLNKLLTFTKFALLALAIFPVAVNLNHYGYVLNHAYLIAFLFTILLAMMIVLYSVITYALKGETAAKVYLIASILKVGSIVNLALLELGITSALFSMEGLLQIGIFIEIALLTYALALRYTNFKTRTFVKVIESHENERALISKEIHDGISSSLTGINYGIKNFTADIGELPGHKRQYLDKIFEELNKVQLEARSISHNTMPDYIKSNSISEIVERHIIEIQDRIKINSLGNDCIEINFSSNKELKTFSQAVKLNIFRIIQEIVVNILKHSNASHADMLFSFSKKDILIIAEDNGIGFSREENTGNDGAGIKNIRTRVELLDGSVEIKSPAYKHNAGQNKSMTDYSEKSAYGTVIKIRIPYRNNILNSKPTYDY